MPSLERPQIFALIEEAGRMLRICNACRYCEGYCAVFPAMERRLEFSSEDVHYLANLCHNCGACLPSCQYAPPHEFRLNFPRILAEVRVETYQKYAWPHFLARLFHSNVIVVTVVVAAALTLMLLAGVTFGMPFQLFAPGLSAQGSFYAVVPHDVMAAMFCAVSAFVGVSLVVSVARFWRDMGEPWVGRKAARALLAATGDALSMRYLDAVGNVCSSSDEQPYFSRRFAHHLTFYGFVLCFAATVVATIYHYGLGRPAPYPLMSAPVLLGVAGGLGLLVGPLGLLVLKRRRDPQLGDPKQNGMDVSFTVLLFMTSLTGLLLLAARATSAMSVLLLVHLAFVLTLFLTLPYGKFVHALYRFAALVRFHLEAGRPAAGISSE